MGFATFFLHSSFWVTSKQTRRNNDGRMPLSYMAEEMRQDEQLRRKGPLCYGGDSQKDLGDALAL
jgi:hypothetical protein